MKENKYRVFWFKDAIDDECTFLDWYNLEQK
jgi:hypothetical protein